jgi:hypothetical protein
LVRRLLNWHRLLRHQHLLHDPIQDFGGHHHHRRRQFQQDRVHLHRVILILPAALQRSDYGLTGKLHPCYTLAIPLLHPCFPSCPHNLRLPSCPPSQSIRLQVSISGSIWYSFEEIAKKKAPADGRKKDGKKAK